MARAFTHRPFTAEAWFRSRLNPCAICGGLRGTGTGFFSEFSGFLLSVSFLRGCPYSYINLWMNSGPVRGHSSETVSASQHEQHSPKYYAMILKHEALHNFIYPPFCCFFSQKFWHLSENLFLFHNESVFFIRVDRRIFTVVQTTRKIILQCIFIWVLISDTGRYRILKWTVVDVS
jgi:hypothetical protein